MSHASTSMNACPGKLPSLMLQVYSDCENWGWLSFSSSTVMDTYNRCTVNYFTAATHKDLPVMLKLEKEFPNHAIGLLRCTHLMSPYL